MTPPDHESLLAIGVSLVLVGVVARGFARSARRELARRKQHLLDDRRPEAPGSALDQEPGWVEKHLGLLANAVLAAGVVITIVGFWRR